MQIDDIKRNFPFLSGVSYQGKEYVGIILNSDDKILSFYDFDLIKTKTEKDAFLKLGDMWWWESNRVLPINIFLGEDMTAFRYCLRTVTKKDTSVTFGPCTSLDNLIQKRIKRRQISLVKKVD